MGVLKKKSPWEREYQEVWRQEQWFLRQYDAPPKSAITKKLDDLAPALLLDTLHTGFAKAFTLLFEQGSNLIAKSGNLSARRKAYQTKKSAVDREENRGNLQAFARTANRAGHANLLVSGASGIGMGAFGFMLPDIPLFTSLVLKSVYETAENYGFPWENDRLYVLRVIEAALSCGSDLQERNRALDAYAQTGVWSNSADLKSQADATARALSEALLYSKVLQNIPVVGAVGGAGDAVCMHRIQRYASIKYHKRFLIRQRLESK